MAPHIEHGMATAEYAVGTLGACAMALVLQQLVADGYFLPRLLEMFRGALAWRNLLDGLPIPNIRS